eukprot:CAMPEP_0184686324 /NCGR_PEP_ID=MMETSP0312-20130426/22028_1 /TAXON_ID=31354 /ORGANISM="Compsopogon coeruleus, Strain SAG 36.94" /LENGTH=347 /DNA_ID=CAMNT_0027141281 /DNA_START=82 /DNA_END=1125 /DNA_ORIENTATION=-
MDRDGQNEESTGDIVQHPRNDEDLRKQDEVEMQTEMVEPAVDGDRLEELLAMGFGRSRAVRALHFSAGGVEDAVTWLADHEDDRDLDEPLLVPKTGDKADAASRLTPEEARKIANEMLERARKKKQEEEKKMEIEREKERLRTGREMAEAKKKLEEQEWKRAIEARRREKLEDSKARAEIREKLAADRRERRIKMGLPPEESLEEQAPNENDALTAGKAPSGGPVHRSTVTTIANPLRDTLVLLKKACGGDQNAVNIAFRTLLAYCSNLLQHPSQEKFRKIHLSNAAFQARVGSLQGGKEFLELCGFCLAPDGSALVLPEDRLDESKIQAAYVELQKAMSNPFFGTL